MRYNKLTHTIAASLAVLALAGCGRDADRVGAKGAYVTGPAQSTADATIEPATPAPVATVEPVPVLEYADVTRVRAVNDSSPIYGTVVSSDAVTQDVSSPQQVCRDVVIEERAPERDGLKGGTIAGAIVGGALGNQAGSGDGKKLATVAGAIAGGYAGREIDRRHEGGNVITRTEQQCETQSVSNTEVIGYDVVYREPDGDTATRRMASTQPIGSRISLGSRSRVVGYDVTYSYRGESETIRMDSRPGDRLPVVDGEVVTSTVAMNR
ncbi:MAG: glycine zipper 2TM domain-containing protein [Arenimonas sp.]